MQPDRSLSVRSLKRGDHKVIGMVLPTARASGQVAELVPLLPKGVGLLTSYLGFRQGTESEFKEGFAAYETEIAALAEHECDIIHPQGAPPFMVQGLEKETALVEAWQARFQTPVFTSPQNHVRAMRAVGATSIFGATYFPGDINQVYSRYFDDAGFEVRAMASPPDIEFAKAQDIPSSTVHAFIKAGFERMPADCVYMLGSAWSTLDIIEPLEQELGVPVIHPQTARVWEFQKRLDIHEPKSGYGIFLSELPPMRGGNGS